MTGDIPTTRGKDGKFLRPEMTTLDAMRALYWEYLPAPKEEEPLKIDVQKGLFDTNDEMSDDEEEADEDEDADDE